MTTISPETPPQPLSDLHKPVLASRLRYQALAPTALALMLTLAACQSPGNGSPSQPPPPLTPEPGPFEVRRDRPSLLLVLDTSKSMDFTDASRLAEQGSQLALALASDADNLGVVAFSEKPIMAAKVRTLRSNGDRLAIGHRLTELRNHGPTDFVALMGFLDQEVAKLGTSSRTDVILLTDARPNQGAPEELLLQGAQALASRGAKLHVVSLDPQGYDWLLEQLANATGGSYQVASEATDVLEAFLRLVAEPRHLLIHRGSLGPVDLLPGARRLGWALARGAPEGRIFEVTHDDHVMGVQTPEDHLLPGVSGVYRYPIPERYRETLLEVISLSTPLDGIWDARSEGPLLKQVIFQEAPFKLRLIGPDGDVLTGEDIPLTLEVETDSPELARRLRSGASTVAELRAGSQTLSQSELVLSPDSGIGQTMRFQGRLNVPRSAPTGTLGATVRLVIPDSNGEPWEAQQTIPVNIKEGAKPLPLLVDPQVVSFGSVWADAASQTRSVTLSSERKRSVEVLVGSPEPGQGAFVVTPGVRQVSLQSPAQVDVTIDPTGAESLGEHRERLVLSWQAGEQESAETVVLLEVDIHRFGFSPSSLSAKPGEEVVYPLTQITIDPPLRWLPPRDLALFGPDTSSEVDEIRLALDESADPPVLRGRVPPDAKAGRYVGRLLIMPPGLSPREVGVGLTVKDRVLRLFVEPSSLKVRGTPGGWVRNEVTVRLEADRPALVSLQPGALQRNGSEDAIRPPYDVKAMRLEGNWGESTPLEPGVNARLEFRAYISSDLPAGTYEGSLVVEARDGDLKATKSLPVSVEVGP